MASLQRKKCNGHYYWYIVESRRVNGKPRPVVLAYLGKAEDLLARLSDKAPFEICSASHGAVAALLHVARSLGVVEIINQHVSSGHEGRVPQRDGITVGESLLLAALGRACQPTSKMGWYQWCKDTTLERLLKRSLKKLDSQHFWDQMHSVPDGALPNIERDLVRAVAGIHPLATEELFFDTTNFFTFIDSSNHRCDIPRRGWNKQKRFDLRQVSLALLVTGKDHIPLFHHLYDGNKNDITAFKENFAPVVTRLKDLELDLNQVTLIFDKGDNSKSNFSEIDEQKVFYIGSLAPAHFRSLIETANPQLQSVADDGQEILSFKTSYDVWGKIRTCVVFVSEELLQGQIAGIHQSLEKKAKQLDALQQKLTRAKKLYPQTHIQELVNTILSAQYIESILKVEIASNGTRPSLHYWVDLEEFARLKMSVLGRQILVTNRDNWSAEHIIRAYRRKTKVEYAFRCLKDPYHLALRPQYHWTDQKLQVHAFICVLAFLLTTLAYARARSEAAYQHDVSRFLDDLARIRLASVLSRSKSSRGRPRITHKLETLDPSLKSLVDLFLLAA